MYCIISYVFYWGKNSEGYANTIFVHFDWHVLVITVLCWLLTASLTHQDALLKFYSPTCDLSSQISLNNIANAVVYYTSTINILYVHVQFIFAIISRPKAAMRLDRNLSHDKDENHQGNSMFKSCSADLSKATLGERASYVWSQSLHSCI